MPEELVTLVDEQNNVIGTAPKQSVHTNDTPLHRAFSLFVFNSQGQLLLTKRAATKKTFPGVWTNTVCGHPAPNEKEEDAARRRLKEELGIEVENIIFVSPYRYRFADNNGIVENEICPVYIAYCESNPIDNPDEIDAWKWIDWEVFLEEIKITPSPYSPWCKEEAKLVATYLLQLQGQA
jgi:isopentenyl-diphosphate delta-isomerase